jgi:hypothetical protein
MKCLVWMILLESLSQGVCDRLAAREGFVVESGLAVADLCCWCWRQGDDVCGLEVVLV